MASFARELEFPVGIAVPLCSNDFDIDRVQNVGALHPTAKQLPGRTLLEIAAFPHAAPNDLALMPQAFSGVNEPSGQVLEVRTTDIAQFDALEVIPNALIRVQVWGIARQLFQMQALSGSSLEKVLDCLSQDESANHPR